MSIFFSSRCMPELKFDRLLSSKPPLTGFLYSIGWRITGFKHSLHTNSISNSAILHNNYISLLSVCAHAYMWRKNGIVKEATVLQWAVRIASCDFKLEKSNGLVHCSVENAVLCRNHCERVTQILTTPSKEKEKRTFWPSGDFLVRYFRNAF